MGTSFRKPCDCGWCLRCIVRIVYFCNGPIGMAERKRQRDLVMTGQAKVTIEHLNGSKEEFMTNPDYSYGVTSIGYSFRLYNGKQMIIHPAVVARIIIEDI